jgi:hypothetical protein
MAHFLHLLEGKSQKKKFSNLVLAGPSQLSKSKKSQEIDEIRQHTNGSSQHNQFKEKNIFQTINAVFLQNYHLYALLMNHEKEFCYFILERCLLSPNIQRPPVWCHVRVHIFNRPIGNEHI